MLLDHMWDLGRLMADIHFAKRTAPVAHRFNTTYAPSSDSILIPRPNPSHQGTRFSVTVLEMFCWI
ncbi:hypothetical protein J010_03721 [Cryptococcus neoformans]|nr:hypothetical protein C355_03625 [Cryptococcus neoformans var. grubii Th84]OXG79222.1 hypothetical protein C350_03700 [Cryptococcus neoformans var. grubii MW-RSA36]OXH09272.1 hypothetical protein J010_03721 [Cryptococcus neoformans var. grubii]OXL07673.1 hypothetical protein C348_03947 [Cryptococcus neoformans var. grubii Gb118]OXH30351.1 hypothetical protein J009_03738 [Cryptococcus neoformans var. grubii]